MTEKEFEELIRPESLRFLSEHSCNDPDKLALKFHGNKNIPIRAVSEQIICRNKAAYKLPSLFEKNILYEKVALEQSSGEYAASYKASILRGSRIIDLTGGLGIDDIFIAENIQELIYCEQDPLRLRLFEYNSNLLGLKNISIRPGNSINTLKLFPDNYFDWIYADPSRRNENRRFIGLQSCSPDIIENQDLILSKASNALIKASPALELEEVKKQLPSLKEFIVISVDNECKEVLLLLNAAKTISNLIIRSVSINSGDKKTTILSSPYNEMHPARVSSKLMNYFYEPDAAIIKARLSWKLTEEFPVIFINNSIDYFTADMMIEDFPGRKFIINDVLPYKKQLLRDYLKSRSITKANIARRDFPEAPEKIKKYLELKDGGDHYLFFTKDHNNDFIVVFCYKADK